MRDLTLEWAGATTGYGRIRRLWCVAVQHHGTDRGEEAWGEIERLVGADGMLALGLITQALAEARGDAAGVAERIVQVEDGHDILLAEARASGLDVYPPITMDDADEPEVPTEPTGVR